jgi:hydrogenase nickel incorporation protein HypA/HybF
MHERSLVRALLEQVREEAQRRGLGNVQGVCVDIGEFAGVEVSLVRLAFEELASEVLGSGATLELRTTPLRAKCRLCAAEFSVRRFCFLCPHCGSDSDLVAGDEVRLVSMIAETPPRE